MLRPYFQSLLLFAALCLGSADAVAQCFTTRDAGEIELALQKLKVFGSVLYVAAHPDDENSALLAYLEKGQGLRTAYLSLNRGEGGQNLIGSEKGISLGILRTAELLAAREVDNAEQIFSLAYDFGYSKSLEETLQHWHREPVLADVVWAIRKFQPDIIVTRFPITGEGKHGQHTASGVLAEEAFAAAADPLRFKEQLAYVGVWQATTLLLNNPPPKWDPKFTPDGKIALDIGAFNRALGKTYGELAAESRNNHKSQGFGTAADAGPRIEYFTVRAGKAVGAQPFAREHFSLKGTRRLIGAIDSALDAFHQQESPEELTEALLKVRSRLGEIDDERWRVRKQAEVDRLLLDVAGVRLEALSDVATVPPGQSVGLQLRALRQADTALALCETSSSWSDKVAVEGDVTGKWGEQSLRVSVPANNAPSNQYWLTKPMGEGMFNTSTPELIGLPFSPAPLSATFTFCAEGEKIVWSCPVSYKSLSQQDGDRYEELSVVPKVAINFALGALFVPQGRTSAVQFAATSAIAGLAGTIELKAPAGWKITPNSFRVDFAERNVATQFVAAVGPGRGAGEGLLEATFVGADGERVSLSRYTVSYPHIVPRSYLQPSELKLSTGTIQTPPLKLGYVMGAGDEIAQSLQPLGYSTQMLDDAQLLHGDLSRFDTIVVGVRALNTRTAWSAFYPRLMEFVRAGGTLVVQYSANDFLSKVPAHVGPYPFTFTPIRVTDERAAVTVLDPGHAVMNRPNRIAQSDFEGWVQERGLWFAGELDGHYQPLLGMSDVGEARQDGALIVATYGKGRFVYTGLAFFRQLPAGNVGAYRLFVNLLHYGR